jgi:hypothetical protein
LEGDKSIEISGGGELSTRIPALMKVEICSYAVCAFAFRTREQINSWDRMIETLMAARPGEYGKLPVRSYRR